jgi:hypothetical protein
VLGSAAIAAFMQGRLEANIPGIDDAPAGIGSGALPSIVAEPFSAAMAQTTLLPASVMLIGVAAVLFLKRPEGLRTRDDR